MKVREADVGNGMDVHVPPDVPIADLRGDMDDRAWPPAGVSARLARKG